jgi:hypothetical protein
MKPRSAPIDDVHQEYLMTLAEHPSRLSRVLEQLGNATYRFECRWRIAIIKRYARRRWPWGGC